MWVASFNKHGTGAASKQMSVRSAYSGFPSLAFEVGSCELGHLTESIPRRVLIHVGWLELPWFTQHWSCHVFALSICEDMRRHFRFSWLILHTACFNFHDRKFFQDWNNFQGSAVLVLVSLGRHPVPLVYTSWTRELVGRNYTAT